MDSYAVTTEGESLWIQDDDGQWTEVVEVTTSPEIGRNPERLDSTHLKCGMRVYKDGVADYSGDLQWTCNLVPRGKPNSNIEFISGLAANKSRKIMRKLPQAGVAIVLDGTVRGQIGGASVNGILTYNVAVTPTSDYAEVPLNETYSITYDANEGTGTLTDSLSPYDPGEDAVILGPGASITREGYNFLGWNTNADGSGKTYTAGMSVSMFASLTLYAQWVNVASTADYQALDDEPTPQEDA